MRFLTHHVDEILKGDRIRSELLNPHPENVAFVCRDLIPPLLALQGDEEVVQGNLAEPLRVVLK